MYYHVLMMTLPYLSIDKNNCSICQSKNQLFVKISAIKEEVDKTKIIFMRILDSHSQLPMCKHVQRIKIK